MEEIFEYQMNPTTKSTEGNKEIFAGVAAIKAAELAWACYEQGRKDYWDGFREDYPKKPQEGVFEVEAKYPRAVAYMKAESWAQSVNLKKAAFGKQAMGRLIAGEDPALVQDEMEKSWAAFQVAQGEG